MNHSNLKIAKSVQCYLEQNRGFVFGFYAIVAAFSTYACMYAFRKPFTVAIFEGVRYWGIDYKILLVLSQLAGYVISKFLGIKIVSESTRKGRALKIIALVLSAHLSLLFFALVPAPYNIIFLFTNGLPLGMVWGLVFSFLEGRKITEILGLGLSVSFIVSSGFVKSVGKFVMINWDVSEFWMPFVTGVIFVIPLLLSTFLLGLLPPPSKEDEEQRTVRVPMQAEQRKAFFKEFAPGLVLLTLVYLMLTAYRDLRDNFMVDILNDLGFGDQSAIFTTTETMVGISIIVVLSLLVLVKNNVYALTVNQLAIALGTILIGVSNYLLNQQIIAPQTFIILTGIGVYMAYVPFNSILFDRLIATYKQAANAGFLIYLVDSVGYLASAGVYIGKTFGPEEMSWLNFFQLSSNVIFVGCPPLIFLTILYFLRKKVYWVNSQ